MPDNVRMAIAEMAEGTENNPEAAAFLKGVRAGLEYNPNTKQKEAEGKEE